MPFDNVNTSIAGWRSLLACGLLLSLTTPALAQRELKDIPAPDPEEERRTLEVADGFEINLFAADPAIAKPIQMNFDSAGRLWIASSEVYPQIAPGQKANDRILVVEDTDHDGTADKTTVFADGLLIPTGVEPGDGGAYVANSTELVHFADLNGDLKADSSRVVLSGFGTEDTHHILHTFRWGPDGLLYINQSIYIHSHIETPYGVRRLNAGGIWWFRPETMRLEVFARGWVNTWGHHFDRWGQSFATDGAGGEGINYVVPGAAYPTATEVPRILHGLNPGSPKYCGLEMVDGRHLPDDWQGNLITNDFRGHRVVRFVLSDDGTGFAARQQEDVVRSNHVAFRPVDVKQGPDGAIYLADWYNPIIQHGEVDFRDPRRDHVHGRIWRISAKNRPVIPHQNLPAASTEQLLAALTAPETWTRHHAKRVLKERGLTERQRLVDAALAAGSTTAIDAALAKIPNEPSFLPAVDRWLANLDPKSATFEEQRLEALWTYQSVDVLRPQLLEQILRSPDPRARAAAVRVVGQWHDRLPSPVQLLEPAITDSHPRVQMEAFRSLAAIGTADAARLAFRGFDGPAKDGFLDYAAWLTARDLRAHWLPLLQAGQLDLEGHPGRLIFVTEATGNNNMLAEVLAAVDRPGISPEATLELLELSARLGGPAELQRVLEKAADPSTADSLSVPLLQSLAGAARSRQVQPIDATELIQRLLTGLAVDRQHDARTIAALQCVEAWKPAAVYDAVVAVLTQPDASPAVQAAAAQAVAGLINDDAGWNRLEQLARETQVDLVRGQTVTGLARRDANRAAKLAVDLLAVTASADGQARLVQALLQQKDGSAALAAALDGRQLPPDAAKIAIRVVSGSGRPEPELTSRLSAAGGITGQDRPLTPAEKEQLVADVKAGGDAARGESIFRRGELGCLKCHAVGGAGGRVGPDLVSIGASAQVDYLMDSLLEPNKQVKEGYNTLVVTLQDGQTISGVKVRQTDTELIVRDAEDLERSIPLDQIDEQANGTTLMPAGLTEKLTRQELLDLGRFLSELGKVGDYAVSKRRMARRWLTLLPTQESYNKLYRTSDTELIRDSALGWGPAYTQVSGKLPLYELPTFTQKIELTKLDRLVSFVRAEVNVTTAGPIRFRLNSAEQVNVWVDGEALTPEPTWTQTLPVGLHTVTIAVDVKQRQESLTLELEDVPGSPAQAQFVTGK